MNWLKHNWHKVLVVAITIETLYYHLISKPAMFKWSNNITEWILKLSRETGIGVN